MVQIFVGGLVLVAKSISVGANIWVCYRTVAKYWVCYKIECQNYLGSNASEKQAWLVGVLSLGKIVKIEIRSSL